MKLTKKWNNHFSLVTFKQSRHSVMEGPRTYVALPDCSCVIWRGYLQDWRIYRYLYALALQGVIVHAVWSGAKVDAMLKFCLWVCTLYQRGNSSALAMELPEPCTNPLIYMVFCVWRRWRNMTGSWALLNGVVWLSNHIRNDWKYRIWFSHCCARGWTNIRILRDRHLH